MATTLTKCAIITIAYAPVAQWIRVLPSEGKGRRFNSDRAHHLISKRLICKCQSFLLLWTILIVSEH